MVSQDKKEKERSDAKNAVEEYVYDMRGKLDGGAYEKYADDKTRQKLLNDLQTTEYWLYDEGSHQEKNVYVERLKSLKVRKKTNYFFDEIYLFIFIRILVNQFVIVILKLKIVKIICKI
jgi:molecular chaperone DnaK (HSP70)